MTELPGQSGKTTIAMRLDSLHVSNFRGFETFKLDLDSTFTLLIGDNGSGKTGLLEAASVALGGFFLGVPLPTVTARHIDHYEVRRAVFVHQGLPDLQPQYPTKVGATGIVAGDSIGWLRVLQSAGGRTTRQDAREIHDRAQRLFEAVLNGKPVDLPLLSYYGTERLWKQIKDTASKRDIGNRFDGYVDCLNPASNHRQLLEWMHRQALVTAQRGEPLPHVVAVERAVCECLQGTRKAKRFYFDHLHQELRIDWDDGEVTPFDLLSDGYRNVVAIVADLAWRAAVLNPQHGSEAPRKTSGVVLIDEIDLHLHPAWQRRVVGDLRRAFPLVQFVATSHSPQVLSTFDARGVRRLRVGGTEAQTIAHSKGKNSNSLLEDAFFVSGRPESEVERLRHLFDLIDRDELPEAQKVWEEARAALGPDDPDVVRAQTMLELMKAD